MLCRMRHKTAQDCTIGPLFFSHSPITAHEAQSSLLLTLGIFFIENIDSERKILHLLLDIFRLV